MMPAKLANGPFDPKSGPEIINKLDRGDNTYLMSSTAITGFTLIKLIHKFNIYCIG